MKHYSSKPPVAIIGIGALFPGDPAPDGFWRDIVAGRDCLSDVPPTHWLIDDYYDPDPKKPGKTYARRGGFLKPVLFDPIESGIPPTALSSIDTAQLLALVVARRVLSDACGLRFDRIDRKRTSVILGVASATELVNTMSGSLQRPVWAKALREEGLPEEQVMAICERMAAHYVDWTENTFPGLLGNVTAGRVANRFDLGGTNCVIDAACASSLGALQMAMQELWSGDADMALTGGVDALNDIFMYMCFSKTPAMSPTGDCRPFSAEADGTMLGEGVGIFALRRLDDAERDGDHIYAVLRGIGSSSDGKAKSIYAPRSEGQELALKRAYEAAGYKPETVELVEAHGTGTTAGDAAELQALKSIFADGSRNDKGWCSLGSVKSQIGHTKAAAGAASLYKAVMALHHKVLPPTIKVKTPNSALGLADSPFSLNTTVRPWVSTGRHPRRASVSSFGFGGSNFHLSLEEYKGQAPKPARIRTVASELFLLSAPTKDQLLARTAELAKQVTLKGFALASHESQRVFDSGAEHRLAIVAEAASLEGRLDVAREKISGPLDAGWNVQGIAYGTGPRPEGKIAFLFPGQGSQYVDMAAEITMAFERSLRIWDHANAAFIQAGGQSLAHDVFPAAGFTAEERSAQAAQLTATHRAQPAIGVTSLLLLDLLSRAGVDADYCAGHSFGELTALHCAGVFDSDDFLTAARMRGELMADAARSTPGAMLAVSASADQVQDLLADHGKGAVIANINGPQQVVVAGSVEEIEAFSTRLSKLKVSSRRLPVATAFHSPIVANAVVPFAERLATLSFASPRLPVIAGSTAAPYPQQPEAIRELLSRQLAEPVRFADQIAVLYDRGARVFVEVGPRGVLTDLVGRCLPGKHHVAIATNTGARVGLADLWMALGRLAALGLPIDLSFAWEGYNTAAQPSPAFSPVAVKISGANYGKVYPLSEGASKAPPPAAPMRPSAPAPSATPIQHHASLETAASLRTPASSPYAIGTPIDTRPAPTGHAVGVSEAGWLSALKQMHEQAASAHAVAQRAMAEAHLAYLAATETGFAQLREIATGSVASSPRETMLSVAPPDVPAAWSREVDLSTSAPATGVSAPATMSFAPLSVAAKPSLDVKTAAPHAATAADLSDLVLSIVAEKTGYPRDILTPKMDLEAELGIDSIKRVEILAAVSEARPDLPTFDTQALGSLRTLGAILEHLGAASDAMAPPAAANVPSPQAEIAPSSPKQLIDIVFEVVSEKTGYPRETLGLNMDLEADLGIDSIKRVEILAAVTAARPDLPAVDAQALGSLRTLAAILAHLDGSSGAGANSAATPVAATAPQPVGNRIARRGIREVPAQPEAQSAVSGLDHVRKVAIVDEGSDLGRMLAARLRTQGVQGEVTLHVPPDADGVVVIEGANATGEDKALSAARQIFTAAQGFAATASERGGIFVTVQDSGGDFGLSGCCNGNAWMAGAPGMIKTLAQEWPRASVKAIDLERNGRSVADLADSLAGELMSGGHGEVGLRADGRRITLEDFDLPVSGSFEPSVLGENPVIVVSAGARGVTASCILALARVMRMRLLLIGRTPLETEPDGLSVHADGASLKAALHAAARARDETLTPKELGEQSARIIAGREVRDTLRRLEQLGSEALYVCADIVDAEAVAEIVGAARSRWGRIDGIIHGAGILADKRVKDKSVEQFERVFSTKVLGLRALLAATEHDQLRLICLFSSVAARFGNAGQADYALANEILNKVARAEAVRRGPSCHVRSLNWGPWDGGMVSPELREHFVRRGIPVMKVEDGAAAFVEEICRRDDNLSHVDVVLSSSPAM